MTRSSQCLWGLLLLPFLGQAVPDPVVTFPGHRQALPGQTLLAVWQPGGHLRVCDPFAPLSVAGDLSLVWHTTQPDVWETTTENTGEALLQMSEQERPDCTGTVTPAGHHYPAWIWQDDIPVGRMPENTKAVMIRLPNDPTPREPPESSALSFLFGGWDPFPMAKAAALLVTGALGGFFHPPGPPPGGGGGKAGLSPVEAMTLLALWWMAQPLGTSLHHLPTPWIEIEVDGEAVPLNREALAWLVQHLDDEGFQSALDEWLGEPPAHWASYQARQQKARAMTRMCHWLARIAELAGDSLPLSWPTESEPIRFQHYPGYQENHPAHPGWKQDVEAGLRRLRDGLALAQPRQCPGRNDQQNSQNGGSPGALNRPGGSGATANLYSLDTPAGTDSGQGVGPGGGGQGERPGTTDTPDDPTTLPLYSFLMTWLDVSTLNPDTAWQHLDRLMHWLGRYQPPLVQALSERLRLDPRAIADDTGQARALSTVHDLAPRSDWVRSLVQALPADWHGELQQFLANPFLSSDSTEPLAWLPPPSVAPIVDWLMQASEPEDSWRRWQRLMRWVRRLAGDAIVDQWLATLGEKVHFQQWQEPGPSPLWASVWQQCTQGDRLQNLIASLYRYVPAVLQLYVAELPLLDSVEIALQQALYTNSDEGAKVSVEHRQALSDQINIMATRINTLRLPERLQDSRAVEATGQAAIVRDGLALLDQLTARRDQLRTVRDNDFRQGTVAYQAMERLKAAARHLIQSRYAVYETITEGDTPDRTSIASSGSSDTGLPLLEAQKPYERVLAEMSRTSLNPDLFYSSLVSVLEAYQSYLLKQLATLGFNRKDFDRSLRYVTSREPTPPIVKDLVFQVNGRMERFQVRITPAHALRWHRQGVQGGRDPFALSYGGRFVSSMDRTQEQHAVHLMTYEVFEQSSEDRLTAVEPTGQRIYQEVHVGIPYSDAVPADQRAAVARRRLQEGLDAGLVLMSNELSLEQATSPDNAITLPVIYRILLSPDVLRKVLKKLKLSGPGLDNEWLMTQATRDLFYSMTDRPAQPQVLMDAAGHPHEVWVRYQPVVFVCPSNWLYLNDVASHLFRTGTLADRINAEAIERLLGNARRDGAIGGIVDEAMKRLADRLTEQDREDISELVHRLRVLSKNPKLYKHLRPFELHYTIDDLSNRIGALLITSCKSAKDRTNLVAQNTMVNIAESHVRARYPDTTVVERLGDLDVPLSQEQIENRQQAFLNGGGPEDQVYCLGIPGAKCGGSARGPLEKVFDAGRRH